MSLPITLKATGAVLLSDELQSYVEEKLKKVEKLIGDDSVARADVELATTGGSRTGEEYRAEINLKLSHNFIRAEATRDNLHNAIDEAVEDMRREVHKHVTKHRDLVRRGAARVKDIFRYWTGK